jgi:hypothetical protein
MPRIIENRLIEEFKDKESFTREDLLSFFRSYEPDLKEGTLAWRIYDLKKKDIIKAIRRGLYTISYKPRYKPEISQDIIKISKKISALYEDVKFCVWDTAWLNEFSQHQSSKKIILVEIEKDFTESLYYELKDSFKYDLFLNPDETAMDFYVSESNQPVVIKRLITRSPIGKRTEKRVKLYTPLIEKMLVDIFSDEKIFYFYQGSEMVHIFENAIKNYTVNYTKLFSYAKRRDKEEELKPFLLNQVPHLVKNIIDD